MRFFMRRTAVRALLPALLLSLLVPGPAVHAGSAPVASAVPPRAAVSPETAGKLDRTCYKPLASLPSRLRASIEAVFGEENLAVTAQTEVRSLAQGRAIKGVAHWTDRAGNPHPVRHARLEVRAAEGPALSVTRTDAEGSFQLAPPPGTGPFFLRIHAVGRGARVRPGGMTGEDAIYHVDSGPFSLTAGTGVQVVLTVGRKPDGGLTLSDSHTAFSVYEAIETAASYLAAVQGKPLPAVEIGYPDKSLGTTCFSGGMLHIIRPDRWDWDILQHEYGHYVQEQLGITESPGGRHRLWQNLSEKYGKEAGIRLAWGEGWATFFPIWLQKSMDAAAWNIPGVGDTVYEDTEDQEVATDLAAVQPSLMGEDNEMAVARVLWQAWDRGLLGADAEMLNRLVTARAATLSAAYKALIDGREAHLVAAVGCILSDHGVAPAPTEPVGKVQAAPGEAPAFRWEANGGGRKFRHDRFTLTVYDRQFRPVFTSGQLSGTQYKPTESEWAQIRTRAAGPVRWLVRGMQTDPPPTGPYAGCDALIQP